MSEFEFEDSVKKCVDNYQRIPEPFCWVIPAGVMLLVLTALEHAGVISR